ncbi:MAG: SRPBCC family protein [Cyclobacteriaceae bacterium]
MTEVKVTKTINAPAAPVWAKIAAFSGIEDFSPIERSVVEGDGEGAKRTCYMPDGAEINETLLKLDNDAMELEYDIVSGPFPFTNYIGKVKVASKGNNSSEVSWGSTFEEQEGTKAAMEELLGGFYHTMIDQLETLASVEA